MTNALSIPTGDLSREQTDLLKRTVCQGATDDEFALFVTVCSRSGLDPFARQIHAVKRWDAKAKREVMSIQTGIDGYRLVAQRSGQYGGQDDAVFDEDEGGPYPRKATVTVYKMIDGTRCPVTKSARWEEFVQTYKRSGETKIGPSWEKMPRLMLAKCAEALALRAAFPQEMSGIYTTEELGDTIGAPDEGPSEFEVEDFCARIDRAKGDPDILAAIGRDIQSRGFDKDQLGVLRARYRRALAESAPAETEAQEEGKE